MTDEDIKRLRDEAIKDAISEALDGGHKDLANLLTALWCDVDRLTRDRDEARAEASAIADALPGVRFMDPPDGGGVPLHEQVSRMAAALKRAEKVVERMADLLRRADNAVIWERHNTLSDGFQEEVEQALAPYDAASAPAEPADTPQADIMGDGDAEGGSGETKTFARPLTWNVMGDGK